MKVTTDDLGDHVCEHGVALDVHCCNCHNGFIFDPEHECPEPEPAGSEAAALASGKQDAAQVEYGTAIDGRTGQPVMAYSVKDAAALAPPCQICDKRQPCPEHGRTPITQADWDELHQMVADAITQQQQDALAPPVREDEIALIEKEILNNAVAWSDYCGQSRIVPLSFLRGMIQRMRQRAALAARPSDAPQSVQRPKIICLCGSTRFIEQFAVKTWELELEGHIVLGCTLLPGWYCPVRDHFAETLGVKAQRDEHHLRKIDLSDEVLVLNIDGYIGESTRNEIAYAISTGKPVNYVVAPAVPRAEVKP